GRGLLAQDMSPGLDRRDAQLRMSVRMRRDIDGIHIGREQGIESWRNRAHAEPLSISGRTLRIAAPHRCNLRTVNGRNSLGETRRGPAGPDDSKPNHLIRAHWATAADLPAWCSGLSSHRGTSR